MSEQSFVINDDNNIDETQKIHVDFYTAIVYLNQFKKTQMNGGYIHIPYFMPSGTIRPNVKYTVNVDTKRYKCINMYIFNKSHNITMDSTFDGELVIELIPTTNSADKLFMVYLLKNTRKANDDYSELDKLIQTSIKPPSHFDIMNFTLNDIIEETHKKIIYKSGIDTVIINTNPIQIYEMDLSVYSNIPTSLFSIYPINGIYKIIKPITKEGFTETATGKNKQYAKTSSQDSYTTTCVPIDVNGEETAETATFMIDGAFKNSVGQSAVSGSIILSLSTLSLAYFVSPWLFENCIAGYVSNTVGLTGATIWILTVSIIYGIWLLIDGMAFNYIEFWLGASILLFIASSAITISLSRIDSSIPIDFKNFFTNNVGQNIIECITKFIQPNPTYNPSTTFKGILGGMLLLIFGTELYIGLMFKKEKKQDIGVVRRFNYGFAPIVILLILWLVYMSNYK